MNYWTKLYWSIYNKWSGIILILAFVFIFIPFKSKHGLINKLLKK